jgi:hypothetical protein
MLHPMPVSCPLAPEQPLPEVPPAPQPDKPWRTLVLTTLAGGTLKGTLHPYLIILGKFEQLVCFLERH